MTASQQPTGHDKAVALAEALHRHTCPWQGEWDDCRCPQPDLATVAALRAALAAGDADVAEALGLKAKFDGDKPGSIHNRCHRRFVTDWTEA